MTEQHKKQNDNWQADWTAHEMAQLDGWLTATPAQRLAWLEEALQLAYKAGAIDVSRKNQ